MDDLLKSERLMVRYTPDQLDRISRAAVIQSRRRGEIVDPSSLVRELTVPAVSEILASATAEELEYAAIQVETKG